MSTTNVAMIGQGFMGRSHSNAWGQVAKFFDAPTKPIMHTVFGQPEENPQAFADNWGWQNASTDWEAVCRSPEIGLVDIVTPNFMHAPPAKMASEAGKMHPGWIGLANTMGGYDSSQFIAIGFDSMASMQAAGQAMRALLLSESPQANTANLY